MVNGFVGLFMMPHRERLQALNRGYVRQSGLHLRDAITEYLDNSKEKILKLHDAVGESVKEGLDRSFAEMVRVINKLELPALLIFYYQFLAEEVCRAFANMDGELSSKENRFIQYLLRQIAVICEDYDPSSAGHHRAVAEEKLEQVLQELDELVGMATVKVNSISSNEPWAKAGIMFRDSIAADAPNTMVEVTRSQGAQFQYRLRQLRRRNDAQGFPRCHKRQQLGLLLQVRCCRPGESVGTTFGRDRLQ